MLRGLAPVLVVTTLGVFVTGLLLLVDGPGSRDQWLLWHKVSFIVWLVAMAPHVLGHLVVELPPSLRLTRTAGPAATGGGAGRAIALASAVAAGAVVAIVLLPDFSAWTAAAGHFHHHHHG